MHYAKLSDENIKNGNWNKSNREKDWMLWLGGYEIIKIISKLLLFSNTKQTNIYPPMVMYLLKITKKKRITNLKTIDNNLRSRTS